MSIGFGDIFGFLYSLIAFAGLIYVLRYLAFRNTRNGRKTILAGIVLLCIHRLAYFAFSDSVGMYFRHVLFMIPEIIFWISAIVALAGISKMRTGELNT